MAGIVFGPASAPRPSWASAPLDYQTLVVDPAPVVMMFSTSSPSPLCSINMVADEEHFPNFS